MAAGWPGHIASGSASGAELSSLPQNGEIGNATEARERAGHLWIKVFVTVAIAANANLYQLRTSSGCGVSEDNEKPCAHLARCDAAWDDRRKPRY